MADFALASVPFVYPACVTPTTGGSSTTYASSAGAGKTELAVDVLGTAASLTGYGTFSVSVDGGAFQSVNAGTGPTLVTLFTGLTDTWHRVVLKGVTQIANASALVVTGAAPDVRTALPWYGTSYRLLNATVDAAVKSYGAWFEDSLTDSLRAGRYWGQGIQFVTAGASTGLRWFGQLASLTRVIAVYVDGVFSNQVTLSQVWQSADLVTGLSPGAHTIDLRMTDGGSAALVGDFYFTCVQVIGGTLDTTVVPDYGTVIVQCGDSISQNSNSDVPASATACVADMAASLGYQPVNLGHQGDPIPSSDNVQNGVLRKRPKNVLVYFGTNNSVVFDEPPETVKNRLIVHWQKYLDGTTLHSGLRNDTTQRFNIILPFPYLEARAPGYTQAFLDAASELVLPANAPGVGVIPTAGEPEYATGFDVLHPTVAKTAEWAAAMLPWLRHTDYSLGQGAPQGVAKQASRSFEVARAHGSTFSGTDTVTLTVAEGAFTVTAVGGTVSGNGTGAVTVTPAAGATAFTFTYLPGTPGRKQFVATNGQSWVDAPPLYYYVAAATVIGRGLLPSIPSMAPAPRRVAAWQTTVLLPTDLPGCYFWHDFHRETHQTAGGVAAAVTGDPIGQVLDLSGRGHPLLQASSTRRFELRAGADGLDGRNIGRADGTSDVLVASGTAAPTQTIVVVARKRTAPTASAKVLFALADVNCEIYTRSDVGGSGWNWFSDINVAAKPLGGTATDWQIFVLRSISATLMAAWAGGVLLGSFVPSNVFATSTQFSLAARPVGAAFGDYDVAWDAGFTVGLKKAQINGLAAYLQTLFPSLTWNNL